MKILIISEYIAPMQEIASIRWTKIAKYLKRNHPEALITVVTDKKDYEPGSNAINLQRKDALLEADMVYFDEYWEVPNEKMMEWYYRLKQKKGARIASEIKTEKCNLSSERKWKTQLRIELMDVVYELKSWLQYRQAKKFIRNKMLDFDVVISSYGPIWPHLLAGWIKKEKKSVVWIADFRDSYAKDVDAPFALKRHQEFIPRYCGHANLLTKVYDSIKTYTPDTQAVEVIPNGYDPDEIRPSVAPKCFSFVFTGTLYGSQYDLGLLFKIINELSKEGAIERNYVEVHYAGGDGEKAIEFAKAWNCEDILKNHGLLPREEARDLQREAAILVQIGLNRHLEKFTWTGKTFEYMMTGKPIIYFMFGEVPYSEASQNIHRLGGCCYEQSRNDETLPELKKYIVEKYRMWKQTGDVRVEHDEEYVKRYSHKYLAERIWNAAKRYKM